MYGNDDFTGAVWAIYIVFFGVYLLVVWLGVGALNHILLSKKGYKHVGLYVLSWIPIIGLFMLYLSIGLPDALMHRKMDYALHILLGGARPTPAPMPEQPQQVASASSPEKSENEGQTTPGVHPKGL